MKEKFTINDIISIVMAKIESQEAYEDYMYMEEEFNIPISIENKINALGENEYDDFFSKILYIIEEIIPIKNGELNELNHCHEEIVFMAEDILKSYME